MALKVPPLGLFISLLQGAADAFVQSSVLTGLSGNQAYSLVGIAWALATNVAKVDLSYVRFTVTRRSKSALPLLSDNDVIMGFGEQVSFTTSGLMSRKVADYWTPPFPIPIVEETIYAQLDSDATAIANNVILRLDVEIDSMSPIDRLNLISRSLT